MASSLALDPDNDLWCKMAEEFGSQLPTGIVTFLFTDVEGSTALWATDVEAMAASLALHDEIVREVVAERSGYVFTTAGDSFAVAFQAASDAVYAATAAQERFASASWPGPALRVRMGLHLGETVERGGDYFGPVVNLTARLESAGHGGQILVSEAVRSTAMVATVALGTHRLRDVADAVVVHQVGDGEFPELRVSGSNKTNLPVAPARLLGRERELAAVREELDSSRLVTLTAAGGTGKTRLALAVGEALLNHQPGGVWFVDLSTVLRDEELPTAIARVLSLQVSGTEQLRQVVDYLCGIDALVILDNCEHLVDACAELLETFLRTPGSSRVLATTREYFDIDGEQAIRLAPLDAHDVHGSAVELFVERALSVESSIVFDAEDRATIAELCRHLDGSPLAIQLAAGRCGVMTPGELLAAIGQRFQLLKGGRRRSKHALEDTLQWSYDLLDEAEQRVFRFLGVFSGTFERSAVASIIGLSTTVTLDLLESLTAKNLVISKRTGTVHRFALLETPSAYAEQLLEQHDETVGVRDRHLDHFLDHTERFAIGIWPTTAATVLAPDRSNLLAAIEWAQARDRWQDAARLMGASYEAISAQPDVVLRIARKTAEHMDDMPESDRCRAAGAVYASAVQLDDFTTASEYVYADQTSDAPFRRVNAAVSIAFFTMAADQASSALAQIADARDQLPDIVDPIARLQLAGGLEVMAAWAHAMLGDFDGCLPYCRSARELHSQLELPTGYVAMGLYVEALANAELGNRDRALELAGELDAIESVFSKAADVRIMAYLLSGDSEAAMPHLKTQALDAVTGRLSREANDSMLFLALLAEHDDPQLSARRLMPVEQTRTPATIASSIALAARLDVVYEFDASRARGREDRSASGRRAIEALATELDMLGWG